MTTTTAQFVVQEPPVQGILATDENMPGILLALQASEEVGIDTETTGLRVDDNADYLMGICLDSPAISTYMPIRHPDVNVDKARFMPHLLAVLKDKPLCWHNRKFDMHSFKTMGVDPLAAFKGPQYDTMMIAQLVNEELWSKELDALAKKYLKMEKYQKDVITKLGDIYGRKNLPAHIYKDYGAVDAFLTRRLKQILWPKLVDQELESVYWDTEKPFTDLLYRMERRGVGVNRPFTEHKARIGRGRMETIARALHFNPASPIDLGRYLLDELGLPVLAHTDSCEPCKKDGKPVWTHEGKPSFNKQVMLEYDDILVVSNNPSAKLIAEYRGWQKATTSLYEPLLEKVSRDGRIRTNFKQHGTRTGRLSAVNPNLQQVPRSTDKAWNGDAKGCFTSGFEGYALYGWDYSQLELRLAASYGQETILLTEFESESADPFSVLAPLVFGSYSDENRYRVKNCLVYPSIYGAGLRKIAAQLGMSIEEAKPIYERYKSTIPNITRVSEQVIRLVQQRGYVTYWDGRRRHIRDRSAVHTRAWNSVLQGGAAQLVKKAMLRIEKEIEDENCFQVLQVHDEITFCIKRDLISEYEPRIINAMTDFQMGVNLHVEGKEWKA